MTDKLTLHEALQQEDPALMNDIIERGVNAFNMRLASYFDESIRALLHNEHRASTLGGAFTTLYGEDAIEREMNRDEAVEKIARALEFMLIDWMELSLQRFVEAAYAAAEQEA